MKKALKIIGYVVVGLVLVVAGGILYIQYAFPKVDAAPAIVVPKSPELVARGEYLANNVAVCIDCHSARDWTQLTAPPVPGTHGKGGERFGPEMGFPGTFYAKNITSDKETGLGKWTDGEIYRAITAGVSRDGSPLFPLMPYQSYRQMSKQDIFSIIAYIRTLDPIKNDVPASEADFPMNLILRTMPSSAPETPEPVLDTEVARGKYLLTISGCGDCHTPQEKGKPIEGMHMAGGFEFGFPTGAVVRSMNITPDKETGIGTWSEDAFVARFKQFDASETPLPEVGPEDFNTVMPWSMYSGMEEEDLRAIYNYLRTVKPVNNRVERFTPAPKAKS